MLTLNCNINHDPHLLQAGSCLQNWRKLHNNLLKGSKCCTMHSHLIKRNETFRLKRNYCLYCLLERKKDTCRGMCVKHRKNRLRKESSILCLRFLSKYARLDNFSKKFSFLWNFLLFLLFALGIAFHVFSSSVLWGPLCRWYSLIIGLFSLFSLPFAIRNPKILRHFQV